MGYKKGDAPFPSTVEVDSNGALENENAQYMLIDVSKVSSSDYSGWKLISSTTGANIDCGTF